MTKWLACRTVKLEIQYQKIAILCNFLSMTAFDKMCLNDLRCEAFTNNQLLAKEQKLWLTDMYCLKNFHFLLHFMILNKVQLWITKLALGEGCSMNQFPLSLHFCNHFHISLPCNFVITFTFLLHFHYTFLSWLSLSTNHFPLSLAMHFQTTFPFFLKHNTCIFQSTFSFLL